MARSKNRGRGPKQKIRDADQRRKALLLRREGRTYDEIAAAIGVKYRASAERLVKRALEDLWTEPAEDVRKIELERLDRMLLGLIAAPEYDEHGHVVTGGAFHGDPRAVAAVVKIQDRRAKYLGLDAPSKLEHTGKDGAPLFDVASMSDAELLRLRDGIAPTASGGGDRTTSAIAGGESTAPGADADASVAGADTASADSEPDTAGGD